MKMIATLSMLTALLGAGGALGHATTAALALSLATGAMAQAARPAGAGE